MMATNGNIFQTFTATSAGSTVRGLVSQPTGSAMIPSDFSA